MFKPRSSRVTPLGPPPKSKPDEFPFSTTEEDDLRRRKKSVRQFRGLTQVRRTLRNEFLPFYLRHTTYRLCHLDIQEYLDTVLLKQCEEVAHEAVETTYDPHSTECIRHDQFLNVWLRSKAAHLSTLNRNLIIDLKSFEEKMKIRYDYRVSYESSIDILPFLKLLATAPDIHVHLGVNTCICCGSDWSGIKGPLETLLNVSRNPQLVTWLEESVEMATLMYPSHVHFQMRKGHGKAWMKSWNEAGSQENQELDKWAEEIGWDIDPLKNSWGCFFYRTSDLGDEEEADEPDEMSEEDKLFWEQVETRNRGRRSGRSWKRLCGRPKLERVGRGKGRWR
jgi:hypothetical protein